MTRKHLIQLADALKSVKPAFKANGDDVPALLQWQRTCGAIAAVCAANNDQFKPKLFMDYIEGKCGPSGGKRS